VNTGDHPPVNPPETCAGLDVSKDKPDLHLWPIGVDASFDNTPAGMAGLVNRLARQPSRQAVQAVQGGDDRLHEEVADDAEHDDPQPGSTEPPKIGNTTCPNHQEHNDPTRLT